MESPSTAGRARCFGRISAAAARWCSMPAGFGSSPKRRGSRWNYAEVTAGGVPLAEIDYRTMQSRVVPGLYLIGEMFDCEGRIGGFNFQWAWSTGHVAGKAAARSLMADTSRNHAS